MKTFFKPLKSLNFFRMIASILHPLLFVKPTQTHFNFSKILLIPITISLLSACSSDGRNAISIAPSSTPSGRSTLSNLSTSSSTTSSKTAKFIFKQSGTAGSFDAPSAGGTLPSPGSGHKAIRVFNSDGTLLANGSTSSTWPKWVSYVEIGISGSTNSAATHANCARFAQSGEDSSTNCNFNLDPSSGTDTTDPVPCGAPVGLYRVSEYDCTNGSTTTDGNGGPGDGVYIRAVFDRSESGGLGAHENVLAVLEYAASAINPAPSTPTLCFTNGTFSPSNPGCADQVWQIYMKRSTTEVVPPYLMLAPPASGYANATRNTGGGGITTKQFILPFAADSSLNVLQISRIKALSNTTTNFTTICSTNSALCVGMIFYSLTFYRM